MGRIINNMRPANQGSLDDLCCEIYQGDYVLVIGNDAVLREDLEGGCNNKAFFDHQVDEYMREKGLVAENIEDRKDKISEFLRNEWEYDIDAEMNPDLVKLMYTRCFRVVLTTTYDRYIEALMERVWGKRLRVINIYDSRDKAVFGNYGEYDLVPPTLVYAMGKADSPIAKFVYTEDNAIELIATRWLDSTKRPNDLIDYIRMRKVLGIGCKLDDWEFRFFWYSLRQDLSKLHGDVAISLDPSSSESDLKLANYLKRKKVKDKGDSRGFLHTLQQQLTNPDKFVYERMRQRMQSGGVFISYATEDFDVVCQINKLLVDHGCKVWFDDRQLLGGDHYDTRISTAIRECKVFIPILSGQTAKDLSEDRDRYYMKEWYQAIENTDCHYIPLAIYGFDIKEMAPRLPEVFSERTIINWIDNGAASIIAAVKDKLSK